MIPYLDLGGFQRRTVMPLGDVQLVDSLYPGWIARAARTVQSHVNTRLRKRYGESIPFGAAPAQPVAAGTSPPAVTLTGIPTVGSLEIVIAITTAGALGSAVVKWSLDGGDTWTTNVPTAASVALPGTGLTANFAAGTYSADNVYTAATPVPEQILRWMTQILTPDVYRKRGVNPQDPQLELVEKDRTDALAQLKEAADGAEGLLDLPTNEDAGSAVTTGSPMGYSEASPYVWTDQQRTGGVDDDQNHGGDFS